MHLDKLDEIFTSYGIPQKNSMSHLCRRHAIKLLSISILASLFLTLMTPAGAVSQDALYQALLKAPLPPAPSGFSSAVSSKGTSQQSGLVGGVDLSFKGGDPKARLSFFVFTDFNAASEFNRNHLPKFSQNQKLLAFPPMARCMETPESGGYCDMWVQDRSVIITAEASRVDGGAALMAFGFRHLNSVAQTAANQPAPAPARGGIKACSLVTQEEVESALHQRVGSPQPDKVGGCFWQGQGGSSLTVQVFETGQGGFDNAKRRSIRSTPLSGIGDDAFGFISLAGPAQLQFIKNGHFIAVILQTQDSAKLETARALATKIAARL